MLDFTDRLLLTDLRGKYSASFHRVVHTLKWKDTYKYTFILRCIWGEPPSDVSKLSFSGVIQVCISLAIYLLLTRVTDIQDVVCPVKDFKLWVSGISKN